MRILKISLFISLASLGPVQTYAAVVINEIAWMGDKESANNEWIELYNTDSGSVSVDGWSLTDSASIEVNLSGTISGHSYEVLERTDDDSAPGSAFLVYTGALSNSGGTLKLKRADGGIEDQVSGGDNWDTIGGDNVTKETAQYTTAGWITAEATPGTANAIEDSGEEETEEATGPSGFSKGTIVKRGKLELPDTSLLMEIKASDIAFVNQLVEFTVEPSGIGNTLLESLKYEWNFGDLVTGSGRDIKHIYKYPGEYVVYVRGKYARHDELARHEIIVLPVTFSITTASDGAVQIHNEAKYEVDLSGYQVKGEKTVTLPPHTVLLPNKTLTIAPEQLSTTGAPAVLLDQAGSIAAIQGNREVAAEPQNNEATAKAAVVTQPAASAPTVAKKPLELPPNFSFVSSPSTSTSSVTEIVTSAQTQTASVFDSGAGSSERTAYLGLIGILGLAMVSIFMSRQKS